MGNPRLSQGPTLEIPKPPAYERCQRESAEVMRLESLLDEARNRLQESKCDLLKEINGPTSEMSKRQREVFVLVKERLSDKEIADKLCIALRTVKFHMSSVIKKMGVPNRKYLWE